MKTILLLFLALCSCVCFAQSYDAEGRLLDEKTPLIRAAEAADIQQIKTELQRDKANVCARDRFGMNALHYAVRNAASEAAALLNLSDLLAQPDSMNGYTPLHEAALLNNPAVTKALEQNREAFSKALHVPDFYGRTPVMLAARFGKTDFLQRALTYPLPQDVKNEALLTAAGRFHTPCVRALVQAGADLEYRNADSQNALLLSASLYTPEQMTFLVNAGANVNVADSVGNTPLHITAYYGLLEAARVLLIAGAKVDAANQDSKTALHLAAREGETEIVKLLLAFKATLECRDRQRATPLMMAAAGRAEDTLLVLLAAGADYDAYDTEENSVLMYASDALADNIVELLIRRYGADPYAKNKRGENLRAFAKRIRNSRTADILDDYEKGTP